MPDRKTVSLVTTVLNEREGCRVLLESIPQLRRQPEEIIIVDGGSTDDTVSLIRAHATRLPNLRLLEAPGANIGRGRNEGIRRASGEVIASTDAGCRLDPLWLTRLLEPFEDDRRADFVAGFYRIDPRTLLERVIGLSTMRGALTPVCPATFNPSARSMAYTKALWRRAGGIPEFLSIDDTLWDAKIRVLGVRWTFVEDALVYWRPRTSLPALAKQFHFYARGGGHTQFFAAGSLYNLRNLLIVAATAAAAAIWSPWLWLAALSLGFYFYIGVFHAKALRVARAARSRSAYPLALAVHWIILLADGLGYLQGTCERFLHPARYRDGTRNYLKPPPSVEPSIGFGPK